MWKDQTGEAIAITVASNSVDKKEVTKYQRQVSTTLIRSGRAQMMRHLGLLCVCVKACEWRQIMLKFTTAKESEGRRK